MAPTVGTTTTVVGTGPSGSITGGAAGTSILLGAGDFTAAITGYNAADGGRPRVQLHLHPPGRANLLVDTVSVVKAPTTVTLTVLEPPVEYGEQATVTALVASSASNKKPDGTVEFTFGGTTIKVEVKGGKATAIFPPALDLGMQQVTAVFTPTDPNLAPSTATKNFRVVRDQTTTEATAVYRALRDRLVAKAKVFAEHGTEVSGSVRFVLKRNGVKIRTATKLLNEFDKAKKVFRNVDRPVATPWLPTTSDRTRSSGRSTAPGSGSEAARAAPLTAPAGGGSSCDWALTCESSPREPGAKARLRASSLGRDHDRRLRETCARRHWRPALRR